MAKPGNTNASKPEHEKHTSFLYVRALPEDKANWTKVSRRQGKKLSVWVTEILNREANK